MSIQKVRLVRVVVVKHEMLADIICSLEPTALQRFLTMERLSS